PGTCRAATAFALYEGCLILGRRLVRPAMCGMSALAAGLRGERVIARKATLGGIDTLSALSPSFSRQSVILRKTTFFVRYAFTALSRDRKLFFSVHGGKASG